MSNERADTLIGTNVAIIGGTGFDSVPPEIFAETVDVTTRAGTVSVLSLSHNYVEPSKIYFLPRHGADHSIPPHQINYTANILALKELGVGYILATNAVGSLRLDLPPSTLVLFDDFIDFTSQRLKTLFAQGDAWRHTDFTQPYSPFLRGIILQAAEEANVAIHPKGTYLCVEGPRFESPSEIRAFAQWGADVVGMTGLPEAVFAKEAGIHYSGLGIVTNYAAGMEAEPISHQKNALVTESITPLVREFLLFAASFLFPS